MMFCSREYRAGPAGSFPPDRCLQWRAALLETPAMNPMLLAITPFWLMVLLLNCAEKRMRCDACFDKELELNVRYMFIEPLTKGEYPSSMGAAAANRLPMITKAQSEMLITAYDFIGLNYYTSQYTKNIRLSANTDLSFANDMRIKLAGVQVSKGVKLELEYQNDDLDKIWRCWRRR